MPLTRRRVTDTASLKALAHPLRMALLGALVTEGPMTATEAAALLDESPSNCSWHLRKLAEHGFVREARGDETGRTRIGCFGTWACGPCSLLPVAPALQAAGRR